MYCLEELLIMGNNHASTFDKAPTSRRLQHQKLDPAELFRTGAFTDVEFFFPGDQSVRAHRAILSTISPLFADFFLSLEHGELRKHIYPLTADSDSPSFAIVDAEALTIKIEVRGIPFAAFSELLSSCYQKTRVRGDRHLFNLFGVQLGEAACTNTGLNIKFWLPEWTKEAQPTLVYCIGEDCKVTNQLWGTGIYTSDAHDCPCLRHTGIAYPAGGYGVRLSLQNCLNFTGSSANGITTHNYGTYAAKCYIPMTRFLDEPETLDGICPIKIAENAYVCIGLCSRQPDKYGGPIFEAGHRVFAKRSHLCTAARQSRSIPDTRLLQPFFVQPLADQPAELRSARALATTTDIVALPMPMCKEPLISFVGVPDIEGAELCSEVEEGIWNCQGIDCQNGVVWGDGTNGQYTSDSHKCTAARHLGIITPDGGRFRCRTLDQSIDNWPGSTRNGITTSPWASNWTIMVLEALPQLPRPVEETRKLPTLATLALSAVLFHGIDYSQAGRNIVEPIQAWLARGCREVIFQGLQ